MRALRLLALAAAFLPHPAAFPSGDTLESCERLLEEGKPAEARALLESAAGGEDGSPPEKAARFELLARCLRAEGRPWDAEAAFGRALEALPGHVPSLVGRGEVFLDLATGAAGADAPRGAEVRALAADARRWLEAAAAAEPGAIRPLRGIARARILDLDFEGAAATLRELAAKDPADAEVRHLLAAALRGAGDREGAAAAGPGGAPGAPARAAAGARRPAAPPGGGRPPAAGAAALEALLRDPSPDPLYRALWEVDAAALRWAPLEEGLLSVLAKHPDHPRALYYLGYVRISAGRVEDALQAFARKAELEPLNPAPLLQVARLRVARSDLAGAEAAYERVLVLAPASDDSTRAAVVEGLHAVGSAHGAARRFGDAERIFRRMAELEPGNASHRMFLGLSLRRLGRYADAEKAFREAVDLSAFDGSPRNELGLLYLGWGRIEEARREFTAAVEEDPRYTPPLENLGNMARLDGKPAEAIPFFEEAYRRASTFHDEPDRLKFRRYLDVTLRERSPGK